MRLAMLEFVPFGTLWKRVARSNFVCRELSVMKYLFIFVAICLQNPAFADCAGNFGTLWPSCTSLDQAACAMHSECGWVDGSPPPPQFVPFQAGDCTIFNADASCNEDCGVESSVSLWTPEFSLGEFQFSCSKIKGKCVPNEVERTKALASVEKLAKDSTPSSCLNVIKEPMCGLFCTPKDGN